MDNQWRKAKACISGRDRINLRPRPIKKLETKERAAGRIIAQGVFMRAKKIGKTVAELIQTDFLSARLPAEVFQGTNPLTIPSDAGISVNPSFFKANEGVYLLIDLGIISLDWKECNGKLKYNLLHPKEITPIVVDGKVSG